MFGASQEQELQGEAQFPKTTAEEEEALKRNTDCVYFLASPLTCKKGSECEYRHSDIVRVNPRDCWFWLNSNCLNEKCGFRHPPVDGLIGTRVPAPVGHSLPLPQNVAAPSVQAPHVPGKQAVSCIFFQKGYCLKGDICPFLHATYSCNNKDAELAAATVVTESQPNKKTFGGLQKCTQEQKDSQHNIPRSVEVPIQVKSATITEMAPLRNGVSTNKTFSLHAGLDDELPRYKSANAHSSGNGNSVRRSNHNQQVDVLDNQSILNGKDADKFSREPSPSFDVFVDHELMESDYYPNEDQFGRTRSHDGRNLKNSFNDYEIDHSSTYHSMAVVERDMYNGARGYNSYERVQGHYGRKVDRVSSERMLVVSAHLERRRRPIADSADPTDKSDLRNHLLKQKRGNGLRSIVSHERGRDNHFNDRIYRYPQRDHMPARENVISSRLLGRIKISGQSTSPDNRAGSWSERGTDRGRHRGRLSLERLQGRLRDRMKGRVQEDPDYEDRSIIRSRMRHELRDIINENGARFTRPKSLSDLKVRKNERFEQLVNDRHLPGKRKYSKLDGTPQQGEGDISFEGPKLLSEILKRKRVESIDYGSGSTSRKKDGDNLKEGNESSMMPMDTKKIKELYATVPKEASLLQRNNKESKPAAVNISGAEEKMKPTLDQSTLQSETEEGMIGDEAMEDYEPEAYEQTEGYSDYEQADGEDYNLEEGENLDPEDEYYEEDAADEFA